MRKVIFIGLVALLLVAPAAGAPASLARTSLDTQVAGTCDPASAQCFRLASTIAFSSTRDSANAEPTINDGEIYLLNPDGSDPRRLTENHDGDGFADLSPDGKRIVFDSNRNRTEGEPVNTSDLFVMNTDGSQQTFLTRGGSPTWSPDGKYVAFHASASGQGMPILPFPGAATEDSDIFVANVDDLLAGVEQPRNLTNDPTKVDDDPDWSNDGRVVFTNHDVNEPDPRNAVSAEIYVVNADGTGTPQRLTFNSEEERGPAWSPDGARIAFACSRGGPDFEICVMNADGTGLVRLTDNAVADLTATWSPDGQQIVFHRPPVAGQGPQLFTMNPMLNPDGTLPAARQLTFPPGLNLLANWGELRVLDQDPAQ